MKINWPFVLSEGGKVVVGLLTVAAAFPSSPVAAFVPPQYQPFVIAGGALATATLQAISAHQAKAE